MTTRDRTRGRDALLRVSFGVATTVSAVAVAAILAFLLYFSLPLLSPAGLEQILSWHWQPAQDQYGILPMVVASISMAVLALCVSFPLAIGICAFTSGLGPSILARVTLAAVHLMTSIPTIVYAFVSAMVLPALVRRVFQSGSGFCLLVATAVLAVLILPTMVLLINSAWRGMHASTRLTCAALGLTRVQELFHVLIPLSKPGLLIALMLGFGRAIGDTMIALLLAGNAPQTPSSLLDSVRSLTAHIACVVATDSQSTTYLSVFACGLILLITTGGLSLAVRRLQTVAHFEDHDAAIRR
jgi:phosphate transport system permease protein